MTSHEEHYLNLILNYIKKANYIKNTILIIGYLSHAYKYHEKVLNKTIYRGID